MLWRLTLVAVAVLVASARGARVAIPCTTEAREFCRESHTSRAIEQCLLANIDRLSAQCASRTAKLSALHAACGADIARFACEDEHVVTCLRARLAPAAGALGAGESGGGVAEARPA